jgi:hypothetical protein
MFASKWFSRIVSEHFFQNIFPIVSNFILNMSCSGGHIGILKSYLTDFSYFFCKEKNLEVVGHSQNISKMTFLKGGVDGYSYFIF